MYGGQDCPLRHPPVEEQSYDHLLETEELTVGWNEYAKAE